MEAAEQQQPEQQQQQQQQQPEQQPGQQPEQQAARNGSDPQPPPQPQQPQSAAVPACVQLLGEARCSLVEEHGLRRVWRCASFCGQPCLIKHVASAAPSNHPLLAPKRAVTDPTKQGVAGAMRARRLGVHTPAPLHVLLGQQCVFLQDVPGRTLQQVLRDAPAGDQQQQQQHELLTALGREVAVLHDAGLIHADLSTANVTVRDPDHVLVLANFEASYHSTAPQDKAADLIVLEQRLLAEHGADGQALFDAAVAGYNKRSKQWSAVFNRLNDARVKTAKSKKKQKREAAAAKAAAPAAVQGEGA